MLKNLKLLREVHSVPKKQLAEAIGLSQQSINKYENHSIEPDVETLIRMADFFQTTVDYLIGHSDIRKQPEVCHPYDLNFTECRIIDGFRKLNEKQRRCIETVIDSYLEK